jgi:hypothetical protein
MGKAIGSVEKHKICAGTPNESAIKERVKGIKEAWNKSVKSLKEKVKSLQTTIYTIIYNRVLIVLNHIGCARGRHKSGSEERIGLLEFAHGQESSRRRQEVFKFIEESKPQFSAQNGQIRWAGS